MQQQRLNAARKKKTKTPTEHGAVLLIQGRAGGDHASRTELLPERRVGSSHGGRATQGRGWMEETACGQG